MAVIRDDTLLKIKSEMQRRNGILKEFADACATTQWDRIRMDVLTLSAENLIAKYPVGTEFICEYTNNDTKYDFPWVVLDNNRTCFWEDGSEHPGIWLGAKYATIEELAFDEPENTEATEETAQEGWYYFYKDGSNYVALNLSTGASIPYTTYTTVYKTGINDAGVVKNGYGRYSHSATRQWLNSSDPIGQWWRPKHIGDVAPTKLNTMPGFMAGFDQDFLSVLHPVRVKTAINTVVDDGSTDETYDTFFPQSVEEAYGSPTSAVSGIEGAYFPYWKQVTGLLSPSNGDENNTNDARKIHTITGTSARALQMRSCRQSSSSSAWFFNTGGYFSNSSGSGSRFQLPACVIS